MRKLEQLEKEHIEYADVIEEFIARPRANGQLVDLIKQMTNYLRYAGEELHDYNEYVNTFMGLMDRLP